MGIFFLEILLSIGSLHSFVHSSVKLLFPYIICDKYCRDHMVVGFTTTNAISAYHHWCCEFESRSGWGVQHYVMKFVIDLQQGCCFLRVFLFPDWSPRYSWNIVKSGVKHHKHLKPKHRLSLILMILICVALELFPLLWCK